MSQKYIEITIDEEGEIESEVKGVLGPDCEGLAEWLAELGEVVEDRRTPDYHRRQARATRAKVGAR